MSHFSKDLASVFRGLYVVKQSMPQGLRAINVQRRLTDKQRLEFKEKRAMLQYEEELAMEDAKTEQAMADPTQTLFAELKEQADKEIPVKKKSEPYKVDTNLGNKLYMEKKAKMESEVGKSTFGQSQQQVNVDTDYSDVPFFMRQDRPKFTAQERYVPSSPASRALHFGMLGVQLLGGTMAEALKQKVGMSTTGQGQTSGIAKYALNQKNADRLANNFKKMRGGALKIGQILSTSEESVLPPMIRDAMEKARSEADIMPLKQVTKNLIREYGNEWQKNFKEINLYPFAAASIGQVHEAILKNDMRVAIKMQYTGISNSIDSDLNNFKRIIDMLGIFPRGLYLNEAIDVARGELHWECDYEREATYQVAYRDHLLRYPRDFYCPQIVDELSTKTILCSEFVDGREIDTFMNEPQEVKDRIGSLLISLCFKELFEFKMMQTDPNPANYLFDENKDILNLLDLGAGRDFEDGFLDSYMQIIWGAYKDNKDAILKNSIDIGFLTGEESKEMFSAHYKGTMIVGEPFRTREGELYDFGSAGLTEKVYKIIPTMSKHRLTPPPQEIYSLHKKIIGTYLMCIKLKARVPAREILEETYQNWKDLYGKEFYQRQGKLAV